MSSVQLWNTTSPSVPPPLFLFNHHQYLRLNINLHHPRRLIIITTILPSIFCPTVPLICYHRPLKPTSGHGTSPLSHELTNHHQHNNLHKNGTINIFSAITNNRRNRCYSAIAIDALSSLTDSPPIRWGSVSLQGPREEMEDDILLRPDSLQGYSFAAVFDGHGGFASVQFLRDELYKECFEALQGGLVLLGKDYKAVEEAIKQAFAKVDTSLSKWLEMKGEEKEASVAVKLGPKTFGSSVEIFHYFHKFLNVWPHNLNVNKYEHTMLLELLKNGHAESEKRLAQGFVLSKFANTLATIAGAISSSGRMTLLMISASGSTWIT